MDAIRVSHLSKMYRVYARPADMLWEMLTRKPRHKEFWALRDVSLEVARGEVVGIIGRNGAGKSTLLKVLARITEPTEGRAEIRGRVGSLLEVGTGFHPELTGRENIFLNGAILGMARAEIQRNFDEIVAFAEIERFLDTPVKRYSSGMYVRLAFAVAAHLDPEILLVDEVLAVGDAAFQKKCLGKMGDVARGGRTILFVSHNMAAVQHLCDQAILLHQGRVENQGEVDPVISHYLQQSSSPPEAQGAVLAASPCGGMELIGVRFTDEAGAGISNPRLGRGCCIELHLRAARPFRAVHASIGINDVYDRRVTVLHSRFTGEPFQLGQGRHVLRVRLPLMSLCPGRYALDVRLDSSHATLVWAPRIRFMEIEPGDFFAQGHVPETGWAGACLLHQGWSVD